MSPALLSVVGLRVGFRSALQWVDGAWEEGGTRPEPYDAGSSGPEEALRLLHRDGRRWREIAD